MLAPPESEYVLENPNNLPTLELFEQDLPLPQEVFRSIPIAGTETDGFSPIWRNAALPGNRKKYIVKGCETFHQIFEEAATQKEDQPCFKYRPYDYKTNKSEERYVEVSYRDAHEMKNNLGAGILYHLQNNPYKDSSKYESHRKIDNHTRDYKGYNYKDHSFVVTLYSSNRVEWVVTDLACSSYSITNTALYDTLGDNTSEFILELTGSPMVVCSKQHIKSLIGLKQKYPEKLANLISIVSMDPLFNYDDFLVKSADKANIKLIDFNQILGLGKLFPSPCLPPSPEALYTISFTSGTTGSNPKGVSLTHTAAASCLVFLMCQLKKTPNAFSFLPLAHIFERETALITLASGTCLIMPQLNYSALTLIEDLKLAKPTRISLVPRVLNKFEAAIKNATIDNPNFSEIKRNLFRSLFESKMNAQCSEDFNEGRKLIFDKLIINKIKAQFGFENLEYMITGSAPIDPETVKFLKSALQVGVSQGYGCTEIFAGFCLTHPYEAVPGSSGVTSLNTEVKIRELPDLNYKLTDKGGPRGELLVRSYQNFCEYFKNQEETEKALDSEGWYHTGDVAQIEDTTGKITIIDRVKNFFKLAQGEFIAPESIENNYLSCNPLLTQIFVHGDSLKNYLVGILGIDKQNQIDFLSKFCKVSPKLLKSMSNDQILELINEKSNRQVLIDLINKSVSGLKGFQKVKNIFIEFEPLTIDRDVVTPTMKVKRPMAKKFFADVLEDLYNEGPIEAGVKL